MYRYEITLFDLISDNGNSGPYTAGSGEKLEILWWNSYCK